jgi:large subunit ribosomal protein L4
MKIDVTTLEAKKAGDIELSDAIFGLEPREDIIQRMVVYQLAKKRAGTQSVNNRALITGTRKKIYRQKGTGGARHGDKKVPQFRGGGKAFGPQPRDHAIKMPKKVRAMALKHALSAKVKGGALTVLDNASVAEPKTKTLKDAFGKMGLTSALIVDGTEIDANFGKAASNIANIDVLPVQGINVYDILRRDTLVLTRAAVEALEARFK